mgnify:CR=1 FL=1
MFFGNTKSKNTGVFQLQNECRFILEFALGGDLKNPERLGDMMQIAMLCGLVVAYPVNAWLIRKGIKEAM